MKLIAMIASVFFFLGCAHHSPEEQRQRDFVNLAETRIDQMENNLQDLEEIWEQQLQGEPREEFNRAISLIRRDLDQAKAEVNELRQRDANTWVAKKPEVDRRLFSMDSSYNQALELLDLRRRGQAN